MGLLDGKVAVISGVARGQGRSHAVRLAEEGADIIGFDLCAQIDTVEYPMATLDDLQETTRLVEKQGVQCRTAKVDVRDLTAVNEFIDAAVADFGRVDIVLANAGIMPTTGPARLTHQAFHDAIDVMLTGVYNTVVPVAERLVAGGRGGSIVITSSTAGLKGLGEGSAGGLGYVAAKHGVVGLMRAWARSLGPASIRVNSVHPTGVNSPMVVNDAFARYTQEFPEVASQMQNILPVPLVECIDVSNAIVFLCSEHGRYVTGQALAVDAGFTTR